MRNILNLFFIVLVTVSSWIKSTSSIFCYDCNSAYDPRCGEEFDSFSLGIVNCSLRDPPEHIAPIEPSVCRSIKMDINGKVRIVRQCGYLTEDDYKETPCRRLVGVSDLFVTYCTCDTDLCNKATDIKRQMVLLAACSIAVIVLT